MAGIAHETVSHPMKGNGLGQDAAPWPIPAPPKKPRLVRTDSAAIDPPTQCIGVSPDILAMISANITNFFGREVRILVVRKLEPVRGAGNQWAGQGRVAVQSSHNLVQRGH
jgi:hypothetical protein